jgi:hypothetical protein
MLKITHRVITRSEPSPSLRGAKRSNPHEIATGKSPRNDSLLRHCEERSDEAIP